MNFVSPTFGSNVLLSAGVAEDAYEICITDEVTDKCDRNYFGTKVIATADEFVLVSLKRIDTVKVDGNADGAVLRVLYIMARECENVTACGTKRIGY